MAAVANDIDTQRTMVNVCVCIDIVSGEWFVQINKKRERRKKKKTFIYRRQSIETTVLLVCVAADFNIFFFVHCLRTCIFARTYWLCLFISLSLTTTLAKYNSFCCCVAFFAVWYESIRSSFWCLCVVGAVVQIRFTEILHSWKVWKWQNNDVIPRSDGPIWQ